MAAKKGLYQIPFHPKQGGVLHYAGDFYHWTKDAEGKDIRLGPEWKMNYEFDAELEYVTYYRGRSAAYFHFRDTSTGAEHSMFMTDFEETIPHMVRGRIRGTWTFIKRGQNYGIRMVSPAE